MVINKTLCGVVASRRGRFRTRPRRSLAVMVRAKRITHMDELFKWAMRHVGHRAGLKPAPTCGGQI
jgi:hypothetical protein